jgi:hypothetical protein
VNLTDSGVVCSAALAGGCASVWWHAHHLTGMPSVLVPFALVGAVLVGYATGAAVAGTALWALDRVARRLAVRLARGGAS